MKRSKVTNKITEQSVNTKKARQEAFIEQFKNVGTIRQACEVVQIHRSTYHQWIREDPEFVVRFDVAKEDANDQLLREARKRAVNGVQDAVYYKGKVVGHKTWHADTLLMFLMKAADPSVYREGGIMGINGGKQAMPSPGGDRMQIHLKQQVLDDPKINSLLCDLEEALVDAGLGSQIDEETV